MDEGKKLPEEVCASQLETGRGDEIKGGDINTGRQDGTSIACLNATASAGDVASFDAVESIISQELSEKHTTGTDSPILEPTLKEQQIVEGKLSPYKNNPKSGKSGRQQSSRKRRLGEVNGEEKTEEEELTTLTSPSSPRLSNSLHIKSPQLHVGNRRSSKGSLNGKEKSCEGSNGNHDNEGLCNTHNGYTDLDKSNRKGRDVSNSNSGSTSRSNRGSNRGSNSGSDSGSDSNINESSSDVDNHSDEKGTEKIKKMGKWTASEGKTVCGGAPKKSIFIPREKINSLYFYLTTQSESTPPWNYEVW